MKTFLKTLAVATIAVLSLGSVAQAQVQAKSSGEVRRIDEVKSKIAIKHGPIADFQLPAMTLVYDISKDLLSTVKAGDKVKFKATQDNNRYTIDEISVEK